MQEKPQQMLKSRLMLHNLAGGGFCCHELHRGLKEFGGSSPYATHHHGQKPQLKMRISICCPDINSYLENPKEFLPKKITCSRNPTHKPHWHTGWQRFITPDHVNKLPIPMFRLYCPECKESISLWPEFILPYQPELIDTHEMVVVENLSGKPIKQIAEKLGYEPRTLSRWIKRVLNQALFLAPRIIPKLLQYLSCELLPFSTVLASEVVKELLAWLYRYAELTQFPRLFRLMGLCNVLRNGDLILWGGAIGRCRYSREIVDRSPG